MPLSDKSLRELFLVLLAKGLTDLFPKLKLIEGTVSDYGFYFDFFLPDKFDYQSLTLIEEKLLLLIHEKKEIEKVSMLKENAINFLNYNKQQMLAKRLDANYSSGIIPFYRLDTILQPYSLENEEIDSSNLKFFKLINFTEFPNEIYRIYGTVYSDRTKLKNFLKSYSFYGDSYHLKIASELALVAPVENGYFWISKGIDLIDLIYKEFDEEKKDALFFKGDHPSEETLVDQLLSLKRAFPNQRKFGFLGQLQNNNEENCRGLWRSKNYFTDRFFFFINKNDFHRQLISSLQFIMRKDIISTSELCWIVPVSNDLPAKYRKKQEKLTNALVEALDACGYPYKFEKTEKAFKEPRAYLTYTDILGKSWKGPFVGLIDFDSNEDTIITQSVYGSLDRYIAHLLEKNKGSLPFSLMPEQVRLIVMGHENLLYANEISEMLLKRNLRVKVDITEEKLSVRIHAAEKEKIPYIAVIGKNEQLHRVMTVRNFFGQNEIKMSVNEFLQELCNKGHLN